MITLRTAQALERLDAAAADSDSAADFLTACGNTVAAEFADPRSTAGCPVAPIPLKRSARSTELRDEGEDFFARGAGLWPATSPRTASTASGPIASRHSP
ncbi:hypothetical protein M2163_000550 [Streptomyces sp. SAI-135]|nr:hypothetical protein [Streptomyces sp. SAI-090]MDH6554564.1 hypothetical protein [Streptomyces sp. SAI-041]MDH6573829.1 hypothetical protein [Streptomyces sp. SAI-117]MDH6581438.1 hypothetical protein [Streptomyces sp. SAI-133]MDH6613442.1 hypothetical protein [Streptomyces sp. SAI-135]